LNECEIWFLTLKEEHILRVSEYRVLRRKFFLTGRKWREAGDDCIIRSFITCRGYLIKDAEMRGT
jgi:hypothetical protein